jgi:signal transduction histidine kinase
VSLPGRSIDIVADPVRVAQILENLLSNASKFTPEGGRIRIEASERPADVEIRVIDSGIGIPREKIAHLFELFSQIEVETPGIRHGGLGIGLALVKQLTELHGGPPTSCGNIFSARRSRKWSLEPARRSATRSNGTSACSGMSSLWTDSCRFGWA